MAKSSRPLDFAPGPNQERWLRELESTDKPHGKIRLCNPEGYTAIGVACELFFPDEKRPSPYGSGFAWFEQDRIAPLKLQELLGLATQAGSAQSGDVRDSIHQLDATTSFKEIAKKIRACPRWYFTGPH